MAGCLALGGVASAEGYKPGPALPFASCAAVGPEADLGGDGVAHRPGVVGRECSLAPGLAVAVLSDDTVSWPVVSDRRGGKTSLEDPVALRAWFPDASPLRVDYDRDALVVLRDARGAPVTAYYTGFVNPTDAPGSRDAFVVLCLRPKPYVVAVVPTEARARRAASRGGETCSKRVEADERGR